MGAVCKNKHRPHILGKMKLCGSADRVLDLAGASPVKPPQKNIMRLHNQCPAESGRAEVGKKR
jgi:hypothetical protein